MSPRGSHGMIDHRDGSADWKRPSQAGRAASGPIPRCPARPGPIGVGTMSDDPDKTPGAPLRVTPADVVRTPSGVVMSYDHITEETKLDLDAATTDPITEMRQ